MQILLLDTRTFKSPPLLAERPEGTGGSLGKFVPNADPQATLLGDEQWRWLEEQLRQPAEVRLVASSGQVVADEKGMDEWGNYPFERRRLFEVIEKTERRRRGVPQRQRPLRRALEDPTRAPIRCTTSPRVA